MKQKKNQTINEGDGSVPNLQREELRSPAGVDRDPELVRMCFLLSWRKRNEVKAGKEKRKVSGCFPRSVLVFAAPGLKET